MASLQAHLEGTGRDGGVPHEGFGGGGPGSCPQLCVFGFSSEFPSSSQCPCCSKGGLVTGTGAPLERGESPPAFYVTLAEH